MEARCCAVTGYAGGVTHGGGTHVNLLTSHILGQAVRAPVGLAVFPVLAAIGAGGGYLVFPMHGHVYFLSVKQQLIIVMFLRQKLFAKLKFDNNTTLYNSVIRIEISTLCCIKNKTLCPCSQCVHPWAWRW